MPSPVRADVKTAGGALAIARQFARNPIAIAGQQVALVADHNARPVLGFLQKLPVWREVAAREFRYVEHNQHDVSIGDRLDRFAYANALGFIERGANAGSVHQPHGNAADGNRLAHQIARGSRRRGHNGALALHQPVEQA